MKMKYKSPQKKVCKITVEGSDIGTDGPEKLCTTVSASVIDRRGKSDKFVVRHLWHAHSYQTVHATGDFQPGPKRLEQETLER